MIAVVGTLATAVILVLNPAEMVRAARDTTRLSDLANLHKALGLLQVDCPSCSFGSANTVYVSIPHSSPTCSGAGLPALPSGWSYACATEANFRKVDGNGWIPASLTLFSAGSPLAVLPVDPINSTSTGEYYTYTTGGSWHLTALLTSQKNKLGGATDKSSTDKGSYPELYELGTNLTLLPVSRDPSLVGYWKFDEGSGTTAYDASGKGNNGTLTNGPTWQSESSCKQGKCLSFDGVNDWVNAGNNSILTFNKKITISGWVKLNVISGWITFVGRDTDAAPFTAAFYFQKTGDNTCGRLQDSFEFVIQSGSGSCDTVFVRSTTLAMTSRWYFLAATYDGTAMRFYVDGNPEGNSSFSGDIPNQTQNLILGAGYYEHNIVDFFSGLFDDVRIYNRVLSASEILAIYNAAQ